MSTIGQRITTKEQAEARAAEIMASIDRDLKREERKDVAKAAGCFVAFVVAILGTAFALVYLVVLAVRLAWGS